jgi:hypothetical protein
MEARPLIGGARRHPSAEMPFVRTRMICSSVQSLMPYSLLDVMLRETVLRDLCVGGG